MAKCPLGKMDLEVDSTFHLCKLFLFQQFKTIFRLAFPERPEDKLNLLTEKVANVNKTDGMIRKFVNLYFQVH